MATLLQHPQVYEINTRVWLNSLSFHFGHRLTLGQIPQDIWVGLKELGMDLIWLMGVWLPSPEGIDTARNHPALQKVFREALPDFKPEDVIGSPYAVADYTLNPSLGDESDLIQVRENLHRAGLGLILDFVPNHTARDHHWVLTNPQLYVYAETPSVLAGENAFSVSCADGVRRWIAHGRDPYFPSWTDTAQLCSLCPETRRAVADELLRIAQFCDGLRCDMAMLLLNRIFEKTWKAWIERTGQSVPEIEYWAEVLEPLKAEHADFILIAEAYWGLGPELLRLGFDYAYDKSGYDRLRSLDAMAFKQGLIEEGPRRTKMVRFLENHDEERLPGIFPTEALRGAAVIHATTPGLRLFHHGQLEGRRVKLPVQLGRELEEPLDSEFASFYRRLLKQTRNPVLKRGVGYVLQVLPAYEGDDGYKAVVGFAYFYEDQLVIVAVNLSGKEISGFLQFPEAFWHGWSQVRLRDELSEPQNIYAREQSQLESQGLYVRLKPYAFHFLTASR